MLVRNLRPDTGEIEYSETRDRPGTSGLAGSGVPILTTAQRDALAGANLYRFLTILNSTTGGIEVYYGATTGWKPPWNTAWAAAAPVVEQASAQTGITTSIVDLTALTLTFAALANRLYRITGKVPFSNQAGAAAVGLTLNEGATAIDQSTSAIAFGAFSSGTPAVMAWRTPAVGSITYKLRAQSDAGTVQTSVSASFPGRLLVEDIGPNGSPPAS